jgi:hypothetical protein
MFTRIQIIHDIHTKALLVPKEVVIAEDRESAVYLVKNDSNAYRQVVKTGYSNATHIEILEGLILGDTVVSTGQGSLKDSARVEMIAIK